MLCIDHEAERWWLVAGRFRCSLKEEGGGLLGSRFEWLRLTSLFGAEGGVTRPGATKGWAELLEYAFDLETLSLPLLYDGVLKFEVLLRENRGLEACEVSDEREGDQAS